MVYKNSKVNFPKDFLWGASTSAYQVEGAAEKDGKGLSQQDVINDQLRETYGSADSSVASGHYEKFKEDVSLMAEMGFTAYRFSISWSRIFPQGKGKVNEKGIKFYKNLIKELKENNIEPIITLYHYDLPLALVKEYGGWIDRKVVADFENYAEYVIREFKDDVRIWTTINEQSIIVQYWTQKNLIPEMYQNQNQLRYQINHHMNLAHAIGCRLVRKYVKNGVVGSALGYSSIYPLTSKSEDNLAAQNANDLRNLYYLDIYFKGHYNKKAFKYLELNNLAPVMEKGDEELLLEGISDFLGVNYYSSECAKATEKKEISWSGVNWSGKKGEMSGFETHPGFYEMCQNPELDTTDWDWSVDPKGLQYLLEDTYSRYNKPMIILENGFGAYDELTDDNKIHDEYRIKYLQNHIIAISEAIKNGVEVWGYCPWSAIDLLSTSNGYKKRYGFVYVDRTNDSPKKLERFRKDSFYWYKNVIATNGKYLDKNKI